MSTNKKLTKSFSFFPVLWKSLWIMWKSQPFQGLFSGFSPVIPRKNGKLFQLFAPSFPRDIVLRKQFSISCFLTFLQEKSPEKTKNLFPCHRKKKEAENFL